MRRQFIDLLDRRFSIDEAKGPSKAVALDVAIRDNVKPGMTLHFGVTHNRPNAAINEIVRQFHGKDPRFTMCMLGVVGNALALVYDRQAVKVLSTFFGDSYPTPGPNRVFQDVYKKGDVKLEQWTILTYPLRFMAGAMGMPWIPTRSIVGSTIAEQNTDTFALVPNPDEPGKQMGMVKALRPDLSFYHAWCADEAGNVLMTPPYGENVYGAFAAKDGVVVTVEKLVSTSFIRKNAHLVKIPGYLVKSVSVVPFGAHPSGITNIGMPDLTPYAEDYEFIEEHRRASKKDSTYDEWLKRWIFDVPNQDEYLSRLGHEKIFYLRGKAAPDSWKSEIEDHIPKLDDSEASNGPERMIVAASRTIAKKIVDRDHKTILAGVGTSNLAAWLATLALKDAGRDIDCMAEIGFFGYVPRPSDPYIFNHRNVHTCKILSSIETIIGVLCSGGNSRCIGVLGAAQVDKFGNINSTCIPDAGIFITGSGGANDVVSGAVEALVCLEQSKSRLPEKVPYLTSPGARVETLVTDLGVFEKRGRDTFILTAVLADHTGRSVDERKNDIVEKTGWKLDIADDLREEPLPTKEELMTLRLYDPRRQFLGDAESKGTKK